MKDIYNTIIDLAATILSKLSILLIVLVLGLVVFSRLDKLFDMQLIAKSNIAIPTTENVTEVDIKENEAEIVYQDESDIEETKPEAEVVKSDVIEETEIKIVSFEILEGQTPNEIAETIRSHGLIQDPHSFLLLLENANLMADIKPGVYNVPANIKNMDLIETITISANPSPKE